ncbi:MAG: TatD family hydrolase [Mariniphaga sp.]|nr:TatD family hydrolase [Mariniphaga sp.]MDD4226733.1 TatD family hydrolase [Mariniphaga sp.]MDD4424797.1 TatD family hydrolase [Mariniphaga sp.]
MVNSLPFIDVHTHRFHQDNGVVRVQNLMPGGIIPAFSGRNFYSVGLHPWNIKTVDENSRFLEIMEDALELDHVIFVGECGLDKLAETNYNEQRRIFEAQAFMAEEYQKPLIIHCVKAWDDLIGYHVQNRPTVPWILHGYNGSLELTQQLSKMNFFFSFGELIFRENSKATESVKWLPSDKIFFETDESGELIEKIYLKGAELKNLSLERLKEEVWENFNRLENVSFECE